MNRYKISPLTMISSSLLTGVLLSLGYIPLPMFSIFAAMIPLWWIAVKSDRYFFVLFLFWLAEFVFSNISGFWVGPSISRFTTISYWYSIPIATIIHAICSNSFVIAYLLWFLIKKLFCDSINQFSLIYLFPFCHCFAEIYYVNIFPHELGYTWLAADLPIVQLAEFGGFKSLTFFIYLLNALLLHTIFQYKKHDKNLLYLLPFTLAITLVGLFNFIGYHNGNYFAKNSREIRKLNVVLIQPMITNEQKLAMSNNLSNRTKIVRDQINHTLTALEKTKNNEVDLVIWPETAFPELLEKNKHYLPVQHELHNFLELTSINLLTGGYTKINSEKDQNSVALFQKNLLDKPQFYTKQILIPFAEYMPFNDFLYKLKPYLKNIEEYDRGISKDPILFQNLKLAVFICYEGIFSTYVKNLVDQKSDVLIMVTNDSWFGPVMQHTQHFYYSIAKSLEYRIPIVRSTNSGISGVITSEGKILTQSPIYETWSKKIEVPIQERRATFFQKYQSYWPFALIFYAVILVLISYFIRSQQG